MKKSDNSAWRLHDILSRLRGGNSNQAIQSVFASAFQLDEKDLPALYRALLSLQVLVDETESRIRWTPDINHELFLRSMPTIRRALAISNWGEAWNRCLQHLTETAVADIAFSADLLSKTYREIPIQKEDLSKLREELDLLFEKVAASSINRTLREVVLDLLEQIRRAIADYQIRGAKVLHDSLARGLGEILLRYEEVEKDRENEDLKAVWKFLVNLDSIVAKVMEYKPLLESVAPLLLAGVASNSLQ